MIYCLNKLQNKEIIEEITLTDMDLNPWFITRYDNGMIFQFKGNSPFILKEFNLRINEIYNNMLNSNIILFEDNTFEAYEGIRNFILNAYTSDIWLMFEDFFQQRFTINPNLRLECETLF